MTDGGSGHIEFFSCGPKTQVASGSAKRAQSPQGNLSVGGFHIETSRGSLGRKLAALAGMPDYTTFELQIC